MSDYNIFDDKLFSIVVGYTIRYVLCDFFSNLKPSQLVKFLSRIFAAEKLSGFKWFTMFPFLTREFASQ